VARHAEWELVLREIGARERLAVKKGQKYGSERRNDQARLGKWGGRRPLAEEKMGRRPLAGKKWPSVGVEEGGLPYAAGWRALMGWGGLGGARGWVAVGCIWDCVHLPNTSCALSNQGELGPTTYRAGSYLADGGICLVTGCGSPGSVSAAPGSVIAGGQTTSPTEGQWRGVPAWRDMALRCGWCRAMLLCGRQLGLSWSVRGQRRVPALALRH
jgi:hypothetical protein